MRESLQPTPYADVNEALHDLLAHLQAILRVHFVGMYLSGSLALGDFNPYSSDIDIVVVTDDTLSDDQFVALSDMHARFDASDSPWAAKAEAFYIPQTDLRHFSLTPTQYPQIERGRTLFRDQLESGWIYQCYILREHGVALAGPDPRTLIDPVDPHDMRRAASPIAELWLEQANND